ncbi:hypothetical protein A2966_04605 [Candidatus Roizmanbacteria bacterium RIFCSPLOWO2_01_FULL_41_22]|uniref:Methionyl-tRNA formyltransferase n=1 Tax=Candidatus Roizmanbacteria bacterium RIFCSPLOWO2_01_FULL_41_22 TaxID=1802067 RepID=A0A1F7J7F0_9BACT|nr:MAG: hypothetical protein A2966_04605 [Candidatus Roizmanbacteria bacterium RIFCSPLOWO2_01_FULL_41_22]
MRRLKIVYFGTPSFSADFLEMILKDRALPVEVAAVVTQPDKPVGRKQILTPPPVKIVAEKYRLPVYNKLHVTRYMLHVDIGLVYAYGELIPQEILAQAKFGFWNIHPSLLPKYRGPSPIAYPLILGDSETGVTLMKMDEQLDHGSIVAQQKTPIMPHETRSDLETKLTIIGYQLFKRQIPKLIWDDTWQPQNHSLATHTRQLTKADGLIPFSVLQAALQGKNLAWKPAISAQYYKLHVLQLTTYYSLLATIFNLFRGLSPWPGLWTKVKIDGQTKRLKIIKIKIENLKMKIITVQLEGKKEVDFSTFNQAYGLF